MKTIAVIGARLNSSRLPRKQMLDLAGSPIIAHIFKRLESIADIDAVVLATTADEYNHDLVSWAERAGKDVLAWDGDVDDLVGRIDAVFEKHQPSCLVYVCGDSPLIEPLTIQKMIWALREQPHADRVHIRVRDGKAAIHEGFDVFSSSCWRDLVRYSVDPHHREHVGSVLNDFPRPIRTLQVDDEPVFYQLKHRLSVDTPSDYRFMRAVYELWYEQHEADSVVDLSWVIYRLLENPDLVATNAAVRQKKVLEASIPVLIVCATGPEIGMGHLSRCLAAARGLQDGMAAGVRLLIVGPAMKKDELELLNHRFVEKDYLLEEIDKEFADRPPKAVVLDWPTHFADLRLKDKLYQMKSKNVRLVSIDFSLPSEAVSLQWIPSFYLDPKHHHDNLRYGWENYLLPFRTFRREWRHKPDVAVLTGGSDAFGLGKIWPELLEQHLPIATRIHWIQGPYAAAPEIPGSGRVIWKHHVAPDNIARIVQNCGYVLTIYGVSFFESLLLGLPTVTYAPNRTTDDPELKALEREQAALVAYDSKEAALALANLMREPDRAEKLASIRGLDGRGPLRLAQSIEQLIKP